METIAEFLLALLAAMGLLCLGWILLGRVLTPLDGAGAPVCLIVRGEGDGAGLEHTVHTLLFLLGKDLTNCALVLLDVGLNEEGRRVAGLLMDRWPEIRLCQPEELADRLS